MKKILLIVSFFNLLNTYSQEITKLIDKSYLFAASETSIYLLDTNNINMIYEYIVQEDTLFSLVKIFQKNGDEYWFFSDSLNYEYGQFTVLSEPLIPLPNNCIEVMKNEIWVHYKNGVRTIFDFNKIKNYLKQK
jgi:hypothetical protein